MTLTGQILVGCALFLSIVALVFTLIVAEGAKPAKDSAATLGARIDALHDSMDRMDKRIDRADALNECNDKISKILKEMIDHERARLDVATKGIDAEIKRLIVLVDNHNINNGANWVRTFERLTDIELHLTNPASPHRLPVELGQHTDFALDVGADIIGLGARMAALEAVAAQDEAEMTGWMADIESRLAKQESRPEPRRDWGAIPPEIRAPTPEERARFIEALATIHGHPVVMQDRMSVQIVTPEERAKAWIAEHGLEPFKGGGFEWLAGDYWTASKAIQAILPKKVFDLLCGGDEDFDEVNGHQIKSYVVRTMAIAALEAAVTSIFAQGGDPGIPTYSPKRAKP